MTCKKLTSFFIAVLFVFSITGTKAFAKDDIIELGVVGAHSGDLAGYGLPALNAAKLVVEEFNAKGGVLGKKIVLIQQDDQCKPELATNAANKMIADGIKIVMGPTCSGATKAGLPSYNEKKIIVVSPSATAPELTQEGKFPYFFRTTPSDDAQARLGADFVLDSLKAKKIALLHDKGDYGKGYAEFIRKFINEDGRAEVVFFEGITPGAMDYSSTIQKLSRSGADTLIFGGYYPEASKLINLMRKKRITMNFVSGDGVKTQSFPELAGKEADGVYTSGSKDFTHLPITQKATENHRKAFGSDPGQFFDLAYAATWALLNAVDKAGSLEPDAIASALRAESVETPIGKIKFNEKGDVEGAGFAMFKVIDGKFVDQNFEKK